MYGFTPRTHCSVYYVLLNAGRALPLKHAMSIQPGFARYAAHERRQDRQLHLAEGCWDLAPALTCSIHREVQQRACSMGHSMMKQKHAAWTSFPLTEFDPLPSARLGFVSSKHVYSTHVQQCQQLINAQTVCKSLLPLILVTWDLHCTTACFLRPAFGCADLFTKLLTPRDS